MVQAHPFAIDARAITQPPTPRELLLDRTFIGLTTASALALVFLVAYILYEIGIQALPAIRDHHLSFLWGTAWDAQKQTFGILPAIWGTLYSSLLALAIGGFFGLTMAIFLTQDFLPSRIAVVFRTVVEMLAAIPSGVVGLWGIFVVIPAILPPADRV